MARATSSRRRVPMGVAAAAPGGSPAAPRPAAAPTPEAPDAGGERRVTVLAATALVVLALGLLAAGLLPVPVLIVSIPFALLAALRPVQRRLAVRNAVRRPRETALVLLGSMLGTAIITGSYIVGDTLDASIRVGAVNKLGPIDELVTAGSADAGRAVSDALRAEAISGVDGLLDLTLAVVSVAGPGEGDDRKASPRASLVEVDFDDAARFGGPADEGTQGISGGTPGPGRAVLGEDLARTLDAGSGDTVEVFAYGTSRRLVVDRTVPQRGIAGYAATPGSDSPNLFVTPGTIAALRAEGGATGAPPTSVTAVSNEGGTFDGVELTDEVRDAIQERLAGAPAAVVPVKRALLDQAEEVGQEFTQLFTAIGFFSVIAGILLLVNIFVMLAEERKAELGMLRAVGMRRSALVGTFGIEGWMYALGAAALGTVVGIGVGRLIVVAAASIFGSAGDFSLDLEFTASKASIQTGFTFGVVASLVTVLLSSFAIARLNVIRAIRDLPEPPPPRRIATFVLGLLAVVLGAVLTLSGIGGAQAESVLLGPTFVGLGLIRVLRGALPQRPTVSVVAAAVLLWATFAFDVVPDAFKQAEINVFVVQGVTLTVSAVLLVTANQTAIGAVVRALGGGARSMALRLGLAYPLARRFRTGMTLAMYALVMFTLTFITVFSHLFEGQIETFTRKVSGGFDLQVLSNRSNPIPVDALRERGDLETVAALSTVAGEWKRQGDDEFRQWPLTGFDAALIEPGAPVLEDRPGFASDRAAYEAVLADPGKLIVSGFFLQEGGGPPTDEVEVGDVLTYRDPLSGRSREFEVVAIAEPGFGNDRAMASEASVRELVGDQAARNVVFATVTPGSDPQEVADEINGQLLANGAKADSFRSIVQENLSAQTQFFRLMQGYLALGLVVGIAGLGVVMVRAVRERRRQIGVLRSLGFEAAAVRRAFLVESSFVALEGILIGASLALVTAWRLVSNDAFGETLEFAIPWTSLVLLVAGTFVISLLATAAPAQQASKIRPAVALRLTD